MRIVEEAELRARSAILQRALAQADIGLCLFQQIADKFYLSGTVQQGFVAVAPDHGPVFLCRKGLERVREETSWPVLPLDSPKALRDVLREAGFLDAARVGFEADVLPVQLHDQLRRLFPESELVDCSGILRRQRAVKSPFEVRCIETAADLWRSMMEFTREHIVEGADDHLVSVDVDHHARRSGGQGLMRTRGFNFEYFAPHILAGPPGAIPAHFDGPTGGIGVDPAVGQGAAGRPLKAGEPILADYAIGVRGYVADGTRTFSIGELPREIHEAADLCVEILEDAAERMRPGLPVSELFASAARIAERAGLSEHFMGYGRDRVRFLGHGVGIELDEFPVLTEGARGEIAAGMVIAVEPKFVFPGVGAVGVEDSFLVRASGPAQAITVFERGPIVLARSGR